MADIRNLKALDTEALAFVSTVVASSESADHDKLQVLKHYLEQWSSKREDYINYLLRQGEYL